MSVKLDTTRNFDAKEPNAVTYFKATVMELWSHSKWGFLSSERARLDGVKLD